MITLDCEHDHVIHKKAWFDGLQLGFCGVIEDIQNEYEFDICVSCGKHLKETATGKKRKK